MYLKPTLRPAEDLGEVFQAHQAELVRLAALGDCAPRLGLGGEDLVHGVGTALDYRPELLAVDGLGDVLKFMRHE